MAKTFEPVGYTHLASTIPCTYVRTARPEARMPLERIENLTIMCMEPELVYLPCN